MLLRLASSDMRILGRGIMVLVSIITIGVVTTERQLNDMTRRQEFVQAINVRRDEAAGLYGVYFLGNSRQIRAVYPVAGIANAGRSLTLTADGRTISLPTVVYFDLKPVAYWLNLWRIQFMAEAHKTKQQLNEYLTELKPLIRQMINSVKQ